MTPRPLIAGNWKMNGLSDAKSEITALLSGLKDDASIACDVLICPPATLIAGFSELSAKSKLSIGAQDCHPKVSGAHTGDLSAQMIKDAGGTCVIVGHSERRTDHRETSELIKSKAAAVHSEALTAIICVGETEEERDSGKAWNVVADQLNKSIPDDAKAANTVIAYEPVWAIGTGRTPTLDEVGAMHGDIRQSLEARFGGEGAQMRILYGGSMKPGNAADLLGVDNVDGGLVGGASLKASDFLGIIKSCPN